MRLILSYPSVLLLACCGLWHASSPRSFAQDWDRMGPMEPRNYVCYRAETPILVDGRLADPAWRHAPWTEPFQDIRGPEWPEPTFRTRARLLWDDEYLYIGALLEEPHVWGTLTERNAIIFYDNDFEIFIDPDGDNHNYYEFEVNALNTIWELTLTKPYKDGGPATHGTNIAGLRSAVFVDGSANAPFDTDQYWSVEIAIPWTELARYNEGNTPPSDGDQWRINFSRVEWQHEIVDGSYRKIPDTPEDNWVWSSQGIVDMHRPERWGFVQFSAKTPGTDSFVPDLALAARDVAMEVYHAQKGFREQHGVWGQSLAELGLTELGGGDRSPRVVSMEVTADEFEVVVIDLRPDGQVLRVHTNQESRIWTTSD